MPDLQARHAHSSSSRAAHNAFARRASRAFVFLCFGIGAVAVAVPIVLRLTGGPDTSISQYYWNDDARDLLVGMLCATGVFLVLFQGLSRWENVILSLAGVSVIVVALVPVDESGDLSRSIGHVAAAVLFFLCLFVVAVFFSRNRLGLVEDERLRRRLAMLYLFAGWSMIALPIGALMIAGMDKAEGNVIFWIESAALYAFALYWFTKSFEYSKLIDGSVGEVLAACVME
ncbi:DUF998 domain-containing protein [Aurantiacibacter aquimixticola]|nr:DUF998 domain-containing protein [Aurantiacibacter aquimixticola]